jgi:hypothetical protein
LPIVSSLVCIRVTAESSWQGGIGGIRESVDFSAARTAHFEPDFMNCRGARRPPISQRPPGSAKSPLAVLYADLKKTEEPPAPGIRHHGTRHQQSFDALEPEAGVARPLVELDPRHAVVP